MAGLRPTVRDNGVRAAFSFPPQAGAARLGVLDVFGDRAGSLTTEELSTAAPIGEFTVAGLLDQHDRNGDGTSPDDLGKAVNGRAVLFQAQAMARVQLGAGIGGPVAPMGAHACAENRRVSELVRSIVFFPRLRLDPDPP